jgi:hypothetical protein
VTDRSGPGKEPRAPRDVDSANVAFRVKAFAWSLIALLPMALIGSRVGAGTRAPVLVTVLFAAAGFCVAFFGSLALGEWLGRAASGVFFSSGKSTAGKREYSLAESMIARGRFDEAIVEMERASLRYPEDVTPPLRLARLLRYNCERPDDAVHWFRTAAARCEDDAGMEIGILRELIEVHTHVLRTPRRALPDLARLASRHGDTAAGKRARSQMAEIRQTMREEDDA